VSKPQAQSRGSGDNGYLRIGDVAGLVGMSPSALRTWEKLGVGVPIRSRSRYRLYTQEDVRLLKRARFLRRVRGLNARAIVDQLRQRGMVISEPFAVAVDLPKGAGILTLNGDLARIHLELARPETILRMMRAQIDEAMKVKNSAAPHHRP